MDKAEPLTESYFYILLCLYGGRKHGYGIMQKTGELTKGRVRIGSGTMYGAVGNMMKKGWITECENPADDRKKLYELTAEGRRILETEKERLNRLVEDAKKVMEEKE